MQPAPKYTDAYITIARIRVIQGRYQEAVAAWEEVIACKKTEWNYKEDFEEERTEIERLTKKIK